jgi:hypothetical protein
MTSSSASEAEMNFYKEVLTRLETTPLHFIGLLGKSLQNGTTNLSFGSAYSGSYSWGDEVQTYSYTSGASFELQSDIKNFNFALTGEIVNSDEKYDFRAYLNRDRLIVGSDLIGDDNYGISFSTLVPDIIRLIGELGISEKEISDFVSLFGNFAAFDLDAYMSVISDFSYGSEKITENVDLDGVNVRRVAYTIDEAAFTKYMRDIVDVIEKDKFFISIFESPLIADTLEMSYSDFIRELRDEIRHMDTDFSKISVVYHIDGNERLVRWEIDVDNYGDRVKIALSLGNSATDVWLIDVDYSDRWSSGSARVAWNIRESGGKHVHVFDLVTDVKGDLEFEGSVEVEWNPSTGRFAVAYAERGDRMEELFDGIFTVSGDTFRLLFEHSDSSDSEWGSWSNEVSFELSTSLGVNIRNVNFVNILRMSLDELGELVSNFTGFGGSNSWDYDYDYDWDWDWDDYDWDDFDW